MKSIYCLFILLIIFCFLLVKANSESFRGEKTIGKIIAGDYKGVNRWGGDGGDGWFGSWIYPSSANCSCPNNYDFIDTMCISRSDPFEKIYPNCYV